jgi:single-strand DNA-binding protein
MANYNKVILIGNLTRDPELRYTPKGMALAKFGLAVNRRWNSETGEQREETTFVDIDAFGKQAETVCQYMKKGSPILVEGRLRLDQWDDKQTGQKRSKLGVVLEGFQFLGSGNRSAEGASEQSAPPPRPRPAQAPAAAPPPSSGAESDGPPEGDDVPF